MSTVNWDAFESDAAALDYLRSLPRYRNTSLASAYRRATFFLSLISCRFLRMDKPLFVALFTNDSCNLRCRYCYAHYGERKTPRDCSTIDLLKTLDQLRALGTRLLTMHGGESMLRKDIGELLNYAKRRGFCISLNTNGFRVPDRIAELRCVDTVVISLDGSEDANDRNRGKGSFKVAMDAIECLTRNHVPCVVSATLTRDSMTDVTYLAELGHRKGFRVQYSLLYNYHEMKQTMPELVMSDEEVRRTAREILDLKKRGYPIYFSQDVLATAIDWPVPHDERQYFTRRDHGFTRKLHLTPCYHGRLKYVIETDGRVIPCLVHDAPDAPNARTLGVADAIRRCRDAQECEHCTFPAYNGHNALMHLSIGAIWDILRIQVADALKIPQTPRDTGGAS